METNQERFERMAHEISAYAETAHGQWRKDCLLVAKIWQAMAVEEAERDAKQWPKKRPA
jgi:hypothetical protein